MVNSVKRLAICLFSLFIFISGCGTFKNVSNSTLPTTTSESEAYGPEDVSNSTLPTTTSKSEAYGPKENMALSLPNMSWIGSPSGDGFYIPGTKIINYYDIYSKKLIALCSQVGCNHVDESCEAWIGNNVSLFTIYNGQWIAIDNEESGSVIVRSINPQSRARRVIYELQSSEDVTYFAGNGFAAYDNLYLTLSETRRNEFGGYSSESTFVRLDMKSNKLEEILKFSDGFNAQFAGATASKVLFLVNSLNIDIMPLSEYSSQNSAGDYSEYLNEMWSKYSTTELRLYDIDMSTYDVVDSGDLWISTSQFLCRYDDYSLYAKSGELYLYNLANNTKQLMSNRDGIINFWIMDGKVFYITSDNGIHLFYCNLDGSNEIEMKHSSNSNAIIFSASAETDSVFYGNYYDEAANKNIKGWIYKSDFYSENYDAVVEV